MMLHFRKNYALLSYSTFNLGDQIQSVAAEQFLPRVDLCIDREQLNQDIARHKKFKIILNGWFCHRPDNWPPAPSFRPLITSFHITDFAGDLAGESVGSGGAKISTREIFANSEPIIRYLKAYGPIGARDQDTRRFLESCGVPSYFAGCLTLALERPNVLRDRNLVVLCDVPDSIYSKIEREKDGRIHLKRTTHQDSTTTYHDVRMAQAKNLLEIYARAHCVITTRLHCALPCLAMNTPVLFLNQAVDQYRFSGLLDLLHHTTTERYIAGEFIYNFHDPPNNKENHITLRDNLIKQVERFLRPLSILRF